VFYDFDGDGVTDQWGFDLQPVTHTYSTPGQYFPVVTVATTGGRFSSAGGWNGGADRLRINVQAPPVVVTTNNITDPVDVKWTQGGHLYVLSRSTATITEFDGTGTAIRTLSGVGTTPNGLDVDSAGNVYVAVTGDNQVKRFKPSANSFQLDTVFNGTGFIGKADKSTGSAPGQFNAPFDVAVSPGGEEISASDSGNNRIQTFSSTGEYINSFGEQGAAAGQFSALKGLCRDEIGSLYVVDSGNNRIALGDSSATMWTSGAGGAALGQFQGAVNLSAGTRGVYVADTGNNRVQAFKSEAGCGVSPVPFIPRFALSAELGLNQPSSVAAVSDLLQEKLYIADTGNNRVILITLPADSPEAVWNAMKQRLLAGDIQGAIQYFSSISADSYRQEFLSIGPTDLISLVSQIPAVVPVFIEDEAAQYRFDRVIQGITLTFPIDFIKENGTWRILEY
jgi:hypothetical protein